MMVAGAMVACGGLLGMEDSWHPNLANGIEILQTVSVCLCIWAVVSGCASYDAISKEKRDGTIGFLFLTDLKGYDVVLGKLISSGLLAFYAALGSLPVLAVASLLGGVTPVQFWKTSLAILNLLFFSFAAAMLGSAWCRDQRNAAGFPMLIMLLYLLGLTALSALANEFNWPGRDLYQLFNPAHTVFIALSTGRLSAAGPFTLSLLAVHLNGWLFLALASLTLPHLWQEKAKNPQRLRLWFEQLRFGSMATQAALRRRLLDINPFFWLASRRQIGPAGIWAAFGFFGASIASLCILVARKGGTLSEDYSGIFVFVLVVLHATLKLFTANTAAGAVQTQRRNGGLEMVLSCTPLSANDILAGLWLTLRRLLFWPLVASVVLGLMMAVMAWWLGGHQRDNFELIYFILTATTMLGFDMIALAWTATWTGLSQPKAQGGAINSLFCVCVIPWIAIGVLIPTLLTLEVLHEPIHPSTAWTLWLIMGLGMDFAICKLARRQLQKNFRRWAVPSYDPGLGLWGWLERLFGVLRSGSTRKRPLP